MILPFYCERQQGSYEYHFNAFWYGANPRSTTLEADALTTELSCHNLFICVLNGASPSVSQLHCIPLDGDAIAHVHMQRKLRDVN